MDELQQILLEQTELLRRIAEAQRPQLPKEGFTPQQVSECWGVKLFTVEQAVASGELNAHRLNKNNTVILREDVLKWVRQHRIETRPGYVPKEKPANARSRAAQSESIPLPKHLLDEIESATASFRRSSKGR